MFDACPIVVVVGVVLKRLPCMLQGAAKLLRSVVQVRGSSSSSSASSTGIIIISSSCSSSSRSSTEKVAVHVTGSRQPSEKRGGSPGQQWRKLPAPVPLLACRTHSATKTSPTCVKMAWQAMEAPGEGVWEGEAAAAVMVLVVELVVVAGWMGKC